MRSLNLKHIYPFLPSSFVRLMLLTWFTQFGDRNPQLLREIKGRLQPRNVLLTVAVSLLMQFLVVEGHWQSIALVNEGAIWRDSNRWERWFEIFNTLSWLALLLLFFLGSYLLVKDIATEERRGTLDFVRLSPASGQTVLLGKLLGVPILLYLAIALAVPLHLYAAVNAGLSVLTILSVYLLATVSCGFVYGFALLHSLVSGTRFQIGYVLPVPGIICAVLYGLGLYEGYQYRAAINLVGAASKVFEPEPGFFRIVVLWTTIFSAMTLSVWWECVYRFHHPPSRR